MNPRFHDEFVALCPLFFSGEISQEEWALLQIHLAYCDSCRKSFEEYEQIAREVIPAMAAAAAEDAPAPYESDADLEEAERRLMDGIRARGMHKQSAPKRTISRQAGGILAACAIVFVAVAAWRVFGVRDTKPRSQLSPPAPAVASATSQSEHPAPSLPVMASQNQREIDHLRQQVEELGRQSKQYVAEKTELGKKLHAELQQQEQLIAKSETLGKQLAAAQSDMQSLQEKLVSAQSVPALQTEQIAGLESQVRLLKASLEETQSALSDKERMLALDQDFLSHDRDIRDLIGARDLYIADIFDTNGSGKTAKPFGRIFYTKDRSLVFYGFDLEKQNGLKQAVAFQAWGSGANRQPVSLGLFYQDDSHKRWVLRFSDAKTLARLNMVFVTVEPSGGSSKPTGKPLLRAYLQIQPNHP